MITTIQELLKYLKDHYPNELPLREMSGFEQGILIGEQRLIQTIINITEED